MSKIVEMKVFDAGLFESYVKSDVDLGIVNPLSVSIWEYEVARSFHRL